MISLLWEGGIVVLRFLLRFLPALILYEGLVQKYKITHRKHSVTTEYYVEFAMITLNGERVAQFTKIFYN